ncbi:hypothetical protein [Actinomadura rifamycini]|uniref:hypothetical protein n=1 Tax=Actinomadura rifamycini TaxID=31962 RepID=UPI00041D22BF|nr:hypothetical protein [Actinomadura rifamycini]
MTEQAFAEKMAATGGGFDAMAPENVSPVVALLAAEESADVTGRVIEVEGGRICLEDGWRHGPVADRDRRWDAADAGAALRGLIGGSPAPEPVYGAG